MLKLLDKILAGEGKPRDIETIRDICDGMQIASLCGLGQTARNPVLTTLRYFRDEYEAHLNEKRCPSARCKALIHYSITDDCIGCTLCAQVCPVDAIAFKPHEKHEIDDETCTRCGMCLDACRDDAVRVA